jgi:ligand-binding SRPBCC domain-containing protein
MMRVHEIKREQVVEQPLERTFEFFAAAHNLERITPAWLSFEVLTPEPDAMSAGMQLHYRLRLHGVPVRWTSRIDVWEPGRAFVDRQVRGPYKLWHHRHEFEPHPRGTLVRDHVRYALPFGLLGRIAHKLFVARDLARIFDYRRAAVERQLAC